MRSEEARIAEVRGPAATLLRYERDERLRLLQYRLLGRIARPGQDLTTEEREVVADLIADRAGMLASARARTIAARKAVEEAGRLATP